MRNIFANFFKDFIKNESNSVLLLGDISVGLFLDENEKLIDKVFNLGILEQSMISFAAGISRENIIPFVHTISPFIIERAFEQIKLELSYNESKCILVSANGPYEYNKLGPTHHCSNDIPLIDILPKVDFYIPGRDIDVEEALRLAVKNKYSSYVRLSKISSSMNAFSAGELVRTKRKNSSNILNVFVGEALYYYQKNLDFFDGQDFIYIWNKDQFDSEILSNYKEINIWEPYSRSIFTGLFLDKNKLQINSYLYPETIENGIFDSPLFIKQ